LGITSIGEAVREGTKFKHIASLLIPEDFAETKNAAARRRMFRTRLAHKAREAWLDEVWKKAGLELPRKRIVAKYDENGNEVSGNKRGTWKLKQTADPRLEREFASGNDSTCYTSCLLRIKLLRGEKLEPWQIYKALHSAIQKRGYDPNIPWKAAEARRAGKTIEEIDEEERKADAELAKKDPAYQAALNAWRAFKTQVPQNYHFPCYYDAHKMKLWDPSKPDELKTKTDHTAESTQNVRFDRTDVAKEIQALAQAAVKQIPALAAAAPPGVSFADYLCYGPTGKPYASYDPKLRKRYNLHLGSEEDWQGVLGQKIPRFDNRILAPCALIPRFHTCRADDPLVMEVTYLMKLKNILVERCGIQQRLTPQDIQKLFNEDKPVSLSFTPTQWKKWCKENGYSPLPGHEKIDPPKKTGRSRFSRPALRLVKELILSGKNPKDFYKDQKTKIINTDPKKGLILADLKFIADLGDTSWESFYIPDQRLDALETKHSQNGQLDKDAAIREVIGSINDPIVRHRLTTFNQRLIKLEKKFGMPHEVVLEFVREDFMGEKAKRELKKFQEERRKEREKSANEASQFSTASSAPLKLQLYRQQGGICLYTGEPLSEHHLDQYEIEHIVPRELGGPDAMLNYVLTKRETNKEKDRRIPFDWFKQTKTQNEWEAYKQRVESAAINNKKKQLLLRADASELVERYTALAETAWISKLAQKIVSLRFGWRNGIDASGNKRIIIISGGLTGRIRRKYRLNHVLNPTAQTEEEAEKKNRDDDRHHALDAMIISFLPGWMRDKSKQHFFRFPEEVQKNPPGFFSNCIKNVVPENLAYPKPRLAQTIYGLRRDKESKVIVQRVSLLKLAYKTLNMRETYDLEYLQKQITSVRDDNIRKTLAAFAQSKPSEQDWKNFCASFRQPSKNGRQGPLIKKLWVNVGDPESYRDLSKDGSGAYFQAEKSHKGQIIYIELKKDKSGKITETPRVAPVYVFDSVAKVKKRLLEEFGDTIRIYGFFQSGCTIEITQDLVHSSTVTLPAGKYRLNTIKEKNEVVVTSPSGNKSPAIGLKKFIAAGLRRVD
ncbi:MAG: hypothetical protein NZM04_01805, partial [Methylacidiphilales bacterium]|nr:hypothetical protein [Candidatus Methylacidiphilales bacterium]